MGTENNTPLVELTHRIENARVLDGAIEAIRPAVSSTVGSGGMRYALGGGWLGHALHPLLTDVPIGAWTSALILDALGGSDCEHAADLLLAVGLAAAGPTALSGWSDWSATTTPEQRRVGIVHAFANVAAAAIFATSSLRRRQGRRRAGKRLALGGAALLGAGGYLGGHLSYARATGVGPR